MSTLLRLDSIGKRFGERRVLTAASLSASPGSVTALVGRNGAGKSTLLQIAAGWIAPDHGWVDFRGERSLRPRSARLARAGLFYLPADRSILSPRFSLAQHLDALERRFGRADRAAVLERFALSGVETVSTAALSGGERRRAELALALLRRPVCALLDEPIRGIDPRDSEVVASMLRKRSEEGCAIVITGHEVDWLLGIADQVVWIDQGTTERLGDRSQAMVHWRFRQGYLGPAAGPV